MEDNTVRDIRRSHHGTQGLEVEFDRTAAILVTAKISKCCKDLRKSVWTVDSILTGTCPKESVWRGSIPRDRAPPLKASEDLVYPDSR